MAYQHFKVEPKDEIVLSDPQGQIIDKGDLFFMPNTRMPLLVQFLL
jgi:hypothetical protein